jgi:hypothetical protein
MSNTDFSEQWKSMQQMFLLNFHHSESMRENARRFWENQNKILDNMEAFTSNWFKRRQKRPHSVCVELNRWSTWFRAYQDWTKGAFERLMADGLACQEQIVAATGALTSPPLSPSEKGTEPARVEAKAPLRAKVTLNLSDKHSAGRQRERPAIRGAPIRYVHNGQLVGCYEGARSEACHESYATTCRRYSVEIPCRYTTLPSVLCRGGGRHFHHRGGPSLTGGLKHEETARISKRAG